MDETRVEITECVVCGSEVVQDNKDRIKKTCSRKCYNEEKRVKKDCENCGTRFSLTGNDDPGRKYCSKKCYHEHKSSSSRVYKNCPICGKEFWHYKKFQQETCSRECGGKFLSRGYDVKIQKSGQKRREYPVCPCGKICGEFWRKYCSKECRLKYGKQGRPPGKPRHGICLGCGEEFTRPASYPSAMKYCSNECAHRERRLVRDKYVLEMEEKGALIIRSLYELRFIATCERFGLEWRPYDGPAFETSYGNYRPDFIVVVDGEEKIIEVKGRVTQREIDKSQESKVPLFLYEDLVRFEETGVLSWSSTVLPTRDLLVP